MMSRKDSCPYFPAQMERPTAPSRSDPRLAGPQPCPDPHLSHQDAPAPPGQPRPPAPETSTPPESAPPANPDTVQSAPLAAATDREFAACTAEPPQPAPQLARSDQEGSDPA